MVVRMAVLYHLLAEPAGGRRARGAARRASPSDARAGWCSAPARPPPSSCAARGCSTRPPASTRSATWWCATASSAARPTAWRRSTGRACSLVPGFVDPHVHLRTPGPRGPGGHRHRQPRRGRGGLRDHRGHAQHLAGRRHRRGARERCSTGAQQEAAVRVGFLAAITVGQKGAELTEQVELARLGAAGFSDDGHPVADAGVMRRALQYQRITGLPLVLHEEDPSCRGRASCTRAPSPAGWGSAGIPSISESVAVARDAALAEYEGGWIHICHVSAAETAEEIRRAKARGVRITGEVTPHHLALTDAAVESLDPARLQDEPAAARGVRPAGADRGPGRRHPRLRGHRPRAARRRREGGPLRGGALRRHRPRDRLRRLPHAPGAHGRARPGPAGAAHGRRTRPRPSACRRRRSPTARWPTWP